MQICYTYNIQMPYLQQNKTKKTRLYTTMKYAQLHLHFSRMINKLEVTNNFYTKLDWNAKTMFISKRWLKLN